MKHAFYLIVLFSCSGSTHVRGQELVGVWQKDSREMGSAQLDCYHLFLDGSFIFYFDGYDGANRTLAIRGVYQVRKSGTIQFRATSYVQILGGSYSKGDGSEHNGWSIVDHKGIIEVEQGPKEFDATLEQCPESDAKYPCIILDNDKFYRISVTPKDLFKK